MKNLQKVVFFSNIVCWFIAWFPDATAATTATRTGPAQFVPVAVNGFCRAVPFHPTAAATWTKYTDPVPVAVAAALFKPITATETNCAAHVFVGVAARQF